MDGQPFFHEHPALSECWKMREIHALMTDSRVFLVTKPDIPTQRKIPNRPQHNTHSTDHQLDDNKSAHRLHLEDDSSYKARATTP